LQRNQILEDIRAEFRANRSLTDPAKLRHAKEVALRSLEQLEAYTGMSKAGPEWQVSLKGACE
jgi:hypothetical protein